MPASMHAHPPKPPTSGPSCSTVGLGVRHSIFKTRTNMRLCHQVPTRLRTVPLTEACRGLRCRFRGLEMAFCAPKGAWAAPRDAPAPLHFGLSAWRSAKSGEATARRRSEVTRWRCMRCEAQLLSRLLFGPQLIHPPGVGMRSP